MKWSRGLQASIAAALFVSGAILMFWAFMRGMPAALDPDVIDTMASQRLMLIRLGFAGVAAGLAWGVVLLTTYKPKCGPQVTAHLKG